nr:MAG TPA: hypothetical protein [Bacteriophage sp.]
MISKSLNHCQSRNKRHITLHPDTPTTGVSGLYDVYISIKIQI